MTICRYQRVRTIVGPQLALLVLLTLFFIVSDLRAEPAHTIVSNGSSQNRVDIAILGDGYTKGELNKFHSDAQTLVDNMFRQVPYKEYQRYYNVHLIDVLSQQSGADHPNRVPQVFVDTALDASYNCQNIVRLICVDYLEISQIIERSLLVGQHDVVIVLVNDPEYGGAGGSIAVASTDAASLEIALHEIGHSFALLADEFAGGGGICDSSVEPSEPNATLQTQRLQIKWSMWIDPAQQLPTMDTSPGVVGSFEGARYCTSGLYRPTFRSKMNVLGMPFEQVNTEQHVKRIHAYVSPIDAASPSTTNILMRTDDVQNFSVAPMTPFSHSLAVTWYVNGQIAADSTSSFTIDGSTTAPGDYTVEARVRDNSQMVRSDPQNLLKATKRWYLTLRPARIAEFDFDGDLRSDLSVRRPSNNTWYLLRATAGYTAMQWGEVGDRLVPADYDGDGKTDVAVYRPSTAYWYIFRSASQTFAQLRWGTSEDIPVPTDRDNDGVADCVLYRPSRARWYVRFANGTFANADFGVPGDKPMRGDFDGDGIGDFVVFRPSNNNWYMLKSHLGYFVQTWGEAGDIPAVGDFDADGATDQAVFRPSTGQWFLSKTTEGFSVQTWGEPGDIPVAADYDGDGWTDVAVYRPSNSTWYIVKSTDGIHIQQFGEVGDIPIQSVY